MRTYERTGDAGLTCRRCGISRPTLRKWWHRYRANGIAGLEDRSRRPHRSPGRKCSMRRSSAFSTCDGNAGSASNGYATNGYALTDCGSLSTRSTRCSAGSI
ncbi:helix-turn-helix domain-containing protein [Acuticoccus sp. 2012]|uniref:Helix-turn-helix domain-containing protein n=1 Tax=Acuticoccus mangrovi TaxID=2796142 RepID=A0A934MJG3_9HYPH|nr:helix-turn-helix domain-containing protein [Acuticoccus mangrovi]